MHRLAQQLGDPVHKRQHPCPLLLTPECNGWVQVFAFDLCLPTARIPHHSSSHRVEDNVPDHFKEIGILLHQDGLVPPLEQVAEAAMAAIEGLGLDPVQLAHAPRGFPPEVNEEVVVIHETVGVAPKAVASNHLSQDPEEGKEIDIIQEDRLPRVSPGGDVVQRTRKFHPQWPHHEIPVLPPT